MASSNWAWCALTAAAALAAVAPAFAQNSAANDPYAGQSSGSYAPSANAAPQPEPTKARRTTRDPSTVSARQPVDESPRQVERPAPRGETERQATRPDFRATAPGGRPGLEQRRQAPGGSASWMGPPPSTRAAPRLVPSWQSGDRPTAIDAADASPAPMEEARAPEAAEAPSPVRSATVAASSSHAVSSPANASAATASPPAARASSGARRPAPPRPTATAPTEARPHRAPVLAIVLVLLVLLALAGRFAARLLAAAGPQPTARAHVDPGMTLAPAFAAGGLEDGPLVSLRIAQGASTARAAYPEPQAVA